MHMYFGLPGFFRTSFEPQNNVLASKSTADDAITLTLHAVNFARIAPKHTITFLKSSNNLFQEYLFIPLPA